jgi:16S rRNA (guanine1207-N2)-methyltransferase
MDMYFKKEIIYPFQGKKFKFEIANSLFSTFAMDHGTDILLRSLTLNSPQTILDLGCGYGPIGTILASLNPKSQVLMIDCNLLAVRYSRINLEKNNISNAEVLGSIGMEQVLDQNFDLIVSNVPAKIGDAAISQDFILTPYLHLNPGGELWLVVVTALNHLIPRIASRNNLNLKEIKKRNGHTVYRIKK